MVAGSRFSDIITTEEELREIIGYPSQAVLNKAVFVLDDYCRDFIAKSPFLLIGSSDAEGNLDVSPKGDPPGFVRVLDDTTLLIPDRPGNRRADTFLNILKNPKIGLIFLIPGKQETLRVSGRATLIRDQALREQMAERGKVPHLLIAVSIDEAFFHCAKCIVRSDLWNEAAWPDLDGLPSIAQTLIKHAKLDMDIKELEAEVEEDSRSGLY